MPKLAVRLLLLAAVLALVLQPVPAACAQAAATMGDFVGVNAVVNNEPAGLAQTVGWVRDYHKWYWYQPAAGVYTWDSDPRQLDRFYRTLSSSGLRVMPVVEFAPVWASANGRLDGIPDPTAHANYLGRLVAHFGPAVAAVENYNEPNLDRANCFPASQLGAMTAQDYVAVKTARPGTLLVLAGLAGADTVYLDAAHRASGGRYDVISFHWYAQDDPVRGGKNPEAGGLLAAINRVKTWRDSRAPGKPIWLTEFGWDTFRPPDRPTSRIYAPEAAAANYLLRALLLMQGHDVERGFVFIYRDPVSNARELAVTYNSAGLVTNVAERDDRRKLGWYYLATLKSVLGDYVLERIVADGPTIYHYEYALPGTSQRVAALWARQGERDSGFQTVYQAPAGTLIVPVDGSTSGAASATDGNITLGERPVFIRYSHDGESRAVSGSS